MVLRNRKGQFVSLEEKAYDDALGIINATKYVPGQWVPDPEIQNMSAIVAVSILEKAIYDDGSTAA